MTLACSPNPSLASWFDAHLREEMRAGSILVAAPSAAFQAPGGGEQQLFRTALHLERLGLDVRPFCPWRDRLEDARLLHLFGMSPEGLALARVANARRVPVVLSPIAWFNRRTPGNLARLALRGLPASRLDWRRELLNRCRWVLPNSRAEAVQLARLFGGAGRIRVVPNGVEPRFAEGPERRRDGVLFVGRIEPRKNLLGLIRALEGTGLPLRVIGDAVPGAEAYAARCRREGEGRVDWDGPIDHDDPRLGDAYRSARVLALPSRFETPGLVALEAGLAGCAVVVTPHGSAPEYFGDRALYARPDRPAEIRDRVLRAWDAGPHPDLAAHIRRNFLWSEVAQTTAEAYDEIDA